MFRYWDSGRPPSGDNIETFWMAVTWWGFPTRHNGCTWGAGDILVRDVWQTCASYMFCFFSIGVRAGCDLKTKPQVLWKSPHGEG